MIPSSTEKVTDPSDCGLDAIAWGSMCNTATPKIKPPTKLIASCIPRWETLSRRAAKPPPKLAAAIATQYRIKAELPVTLTLDSHPRSTRISAILDEACPQGYGLRTRQAWETYGIKLLSHSTRLRDSG